MKKFFLIPVLTLFACVSAWATEIVVNDFASLKTALSASGTADVVKLGKDITYGSEVLNIERSLTLDGQGHEIIGSVACELSITATEKTFIRNTIIAVNRGNVGSNLDVKVKNLFIQHSGADRREICFAIFDGVSKFALDGVETDGLTLKQDLQALLITGADATPVQLNIVNSKLETASGKYPAYILKPVTGTITNTTIAGYCGLYFKYRWFDGGSGYGNTVGSRGTNLYIDACTFNCANTLTGKSNNFAIFPLEDDGITLNLNNCSFNASTLGNTYQRFVNLQYWKRGGDANNEATAQAININITGDNTHLYNVTADKVAFNAWSMKLNGPSGDGNNDTKVTATLNFNISGGTFTFDPTEVHWVLASDNVIRVENYVGGSGAITIDLEKYQINEVNQGGKTVYRVVKKAQEKTPGVMYDLNDLVPVEGEGYGDNPVSSFELSTGSTMTLNQTTTTAGYVEVKDNGSSEGTTVQVGKVVSEAKVDQILVVNNGLDVQGSSKVDVQAGSALVVGDGGIVTANAGNIVLNADANDGCASLLLDPAVTVNQTPALTVKMKAEQIGTDGVDYYWHRFAMPVASVTSLPSSPAVGTALYGWDYANQTWEALSGFDQMVPFAGYTLTSNSNPRADITYTFQGNLTGNIPTNLAFSHQGYNFFGNSYTGYIKVSYLATEILGNADIDGSIWMWNPETQGYAAVPLQGLIDAENGGWAAMYPNWQREIAPMQTFIFRLPNTSSASAAVDYETTIWNNPRYGNTTPAPVRVNTIEGAIVRLSVADANGNSDEMLFMEKDAYSDAYERGYDATKYMNSNSINMYTMQNGEKLSSVATDNLSGKAFDIDTKDAISYTLTINAVLGDAEYAIKDIVTNSIVTLTNGNTYTFTAQPNSTVAGRFTFVPIQNMPTDVETVEAASNVRGIYTITGQYVGEDFETLPAGVYVIDGVKIVK